MLFERVQSYPCKQQLGQKHLLGRDLHDPWAALAHDHRPPHALVPLLLLRFLARQHHRASGRFFWMRHVQRPLHLCVRTCNRRRRCGPKGGLHWA